MKSNQRKPLLIVVLILVIIALALVLWSILRPQASNEVVVGAVLPMTGDAAQYGEWARRGADLAVQEINVQGGLRGQLLALDVQDSQTNATAGLSAFQHLLAVRRPPVVLTTLTGVCRALIPVAEENRIVLFANATLPGLTEGHDVVFRNVTSLSSDVAAMAAYAGEELAAPPVGILWRNDEFGVWGSREFARRYEALGGEVVASTAYDPAVDDFRTHLGHLAQAAPSVVYLLGYSEVGRAARQARQLGYDWQFLGITTMGDPDSIRLAEGALEGALFTEPAFSSDSSDPRVAAFVDRYRQVYGDDPEVWGATFYDAVHLVAEAWRRRANEALTAESLRAGLLSIRDYPGVTGVTSFLATGDVKKSVQLKRIENGQPQPLPAQ